jgi:hypothetical protein
MKSTRILSTLVKMLFATLVVSFLCYTPEIAQFAVDHSMGGLYSFLFGSPDAALTIANIPAVMTQFSQQVEKRPRPNNGFMQFAIDESDLVQGKTVIRPVSGDDPDSVTDPTVFPLKIQNKDDDRNQYDLSLHATLPQRISDLLQLQVNYALRQNIIDRHMAVIDNKVARKIMLDWTPTNSANIVYTSGAAKAAGLLTFGATGTRKSTAKADILNAIKLLREDDIDADLKMLIPASFQQELKAMTGFIDYNTTGRVDALAKGLIGNIDGCEVMLRSTGVIYDENGVPLMYVVKLI